MQKITTAPISIPSKKNTEPISSSLSGSYFSSAPSVGKSFSCSSRAPAQTKSNSLNTNRKSMSPNPNKMSTTPIFREYKNSKEFGGTSYGSFNKIL